MKNYFFRCTAIFILILSLGVGTAWADEITVYITGEIFIGTGEDAWDNATSTIKVDVRKGHPECFDCDGFNGLYNQDMTNTGYTYNGYPIYSYTLNQAGAQFRFKHYKSGVFKENYTTDWHSTTNQIYRGYYEEAHHWATYGRDVTFYATPEKMDGSKWEEGTHSLFANFKYGDGESEWKRQQMTKTAYTYNGDAIYTCTMLLPYNVIKNVQFLYNDGSDHELYVYTPSPQLTANDVDGKVFRGYISSAHTWAAYGRDVTIYTIPDYLFKDKGTPYDESIHYPAVCIQMGTGTTWNTENLTKTAYTYDSYPIYSGTILIDQNKFWEYQIKYFKKSDDTQVDLYQFNNDEPKTEYAPSYIDDKLYHGWNGASHDFFSYRYDVTLDMQGGGGGSTSIIAIDGSAMPSATMPGRDGYAFGGYWTETNGGGTQYYNSDGSSTRNWDSRTITTLYAKWTARNYTVNLEDPPTTTPITVTFDAALSAIIPPTKMYYTFDGYWTDNDDTGATLDKQLIDEDGNWKKSISPYTGTNGDNATWIYPNGKSLYAKWDEDLHDVTIAVYPADAGVVQVSGETVSSVSDVGYVTHSPVLTAVPTNAAWVFKEWQVTSNAHLDLEHYSRTGTAMKITATGDEQTLTAVFEPRYVLVGSIWNDGSGNPSGGMPGWMSQGYGADFTFNSFTALGTGEGTGVDLSCSRDLLENTTYKFQIYDRKDGNYGYRPLGDGTAIFLGDGDSFLFDDQNMDVWVAAVGAGKYTFRITNITLSDGHYYPTVTIERPHQLHMGHVHAEIDNTSATTSGDTGGTLSATIGESPISNDGWYSYGADIAYTASPATGYTAKWYTDNTYSSEFPEQPANSWTDYNVTHDENVYVRFTEKSTSVTLANDGNGHVTIGGNTETSTTCGVTTTRELTAVPNDGYMFSSWTKTSGDDITISSTSTNPTTLRGQGAGATSGQTVTANFAYRWALIAESAGWGESEFIIENITTDGSGDVVGYVEISLAANTNYQFTMKDLLTSDIYKNNNTAVQYMTYTIHTDWGFDKTYTFNCGITTAGKGTYRFTWNVTDKTMTVTYPTSYQVNYGSSVGGSVTSVKDGDNNDVPNGGYVCSGGRVTYTAAANAYYTFVGWCNNETYGTPFNTELSWTNSNVTETQNSFAKFKSTNFVIYRSGDMAEDDRAALDDVESYAGGTISEAIEFRMKVHTLDQWYSLCLPFTVNAVKVWDDEDNEYYDIEPYYRTAVGEPLQGGYYIIRTPSSTTDFPIANFDDWRDPTSPTGYVPAKNTPYIIQWHMDYFSGKYISFFGATGQEIDDEFTAGTAPSADNVVNIYGNNAMVSGSVAGAYMLEPDYGSDGAWLRLEDASASRTVLPFECYILASVPTRTRYRVIRPGMPTDDTPTGWDDVVNTEPRTDIMVYTITGFPVARYSDCSFAEAARRLKTGHGEGIYILRSGNESVKLMVGGK
jgi:hypothetical protein